MKPTVLGELRHVCMACGAGCHGTDVRVVDEERAGIAAWAGRLGVSDPLDGEHLRKESGRCVFLGEDRRCRIHAAGGPEAKPRVCRQYPLFARQVGLQVRLGIDPGCFHAWRSWEGGPEVPDGTELDRSRGGQPMAWNPEEDALLAFLHPDKRSVADVLEGLGGGGLVGRIAARLVDSRIGERVAHPDTAASLREALGGVSARLAELDPASVPPLGLDPAMDRWTVEVARRVVWLRLPADARPVGRLLGVLAGALACAWADPAPEAYGPALAAWTRVIRTEARLDLWPDDEALSATLQG